MFKNFINYLELYNQTLNEGQKNIKSIFVFNMVKDISTILQLNTEQFSNTIQVSEID